MLNETLLKTHWDEISEDVHQLWGKLTVQELNMAHSNISNFIGVVRKKYSLTKDEVSDALETLLNKSIERETSQSRMTNEGPSPHKPGDPANTREIPV